METWSLFSSCLENINNCRTFPEARIPAARSPHTVSHMNIASDLALPIWRHTSNSNVEDACVQESKKTSKQKTHSLPTVHLNTKTWGMGELGGAFWHHFLKKHHNLEKKTLKTFEIHMFSYTFHQQWSKHVVSQSFKKVLLRHVFLSFHFNMDWRLFGRANQPWPARPAQARPGHPASPKASGTPKKQNSLFKETSKTFWKQRFSSAVPQMWSTQFVFQRVFKVYWFFRQCFLEVFVFAIWSVDCLGEPTSLGRLGQPIKKKNLAEGPAPNDKSNNSS